MKYKVVTPIEIPDSSRGLPVLNKKTKWVQIGSAWSDNGDGKVTVALSALPFRSEFIYLFPVDKEEE